MCSITSILQKTLKIAMKIRFNYADKTFNSSISRKSLKLMVNQIFITEKVALSYINYIFCSDEYLLKINQNSLNHDYYTDIITFPLHERNKPIEGEIYISIDRVKDNAKSLKISFKTELLRVIAHGALHLCGYKDKTKAQILEMRNKESFYINIT